MNLILSIIIGSLFLLKPSNSFASDDQNTQSDYLVVGNGILGLSTAYEILERDPEAEVTLIGPEQAKVNATRAAGAMIGCFGEITEGVFHSSEHTQKFLMGYEAQKQWNGWYQKITQHPLLPQETKQKFKDNPSLKKGTFIILNTVSGELDTINFDLIKNKLAEYKEPYELLTTDALIKRIKGYNPSPQHRSNLALWLPNEGFVNPNEVLDCLAEIISKHKNVKIIDDHVTEIFTIDQKVTGVNTQKSGVKKAEKIVLATGAFTQQLTDTIPELEGKIRMLSGMGYAFIVPNTFGIEHVIRTPNRAGACGLHVVPRTDGTLYVGASNNVRKEPAFYPTVDIATFVQTCGMEQINVDMCCSPIIESIVGNRPVTLDGLPLLGASDSIKGLYFITGTYRDGFSHAPLLSKLVVENMVNGTAINNGIFAPERKPIQPYTKEEMVAEAVKHTMAMTHERQAKLPISNWNIINKKAYILIFNELYDSLVEKYSEISLDILLAGIYDEKKI